MNYVRFFLVEPRFLGYGLLLTFASSFGQTFFISISVKTAGTELGLGESKLGFLYSAATLVSAGLLPWVGRFIDRWDLRLYSVVVCVGLGIACFTMSMATTVPLLFLAFLLLRLFGQGLLGHTAGTSMGRYFDAERGKAMSFISLGYPLGEAVFPTLMILVIGVVGWRSSWQLIGGSVALFVVPLVWVLLKGQEERHRRLEARTEAAAREGRVADGWTRGRVLRDPRFYCVLPVILAPPFIGTGVFFHQAWLCETKTWSRELFSSAFVAYAVATVVMSLATGPLVDRFRARSLLGLYLIPQAAALTVLASFEASPSAFVYMIGAGMTSGAGSPIAGALWAELYGVKHLGAIRSLVYGAMVLSTACAPGPLGWLIEQGVSVGTLGVSGAGYCLLASLAAGLGTRRLSTG